jgi:glycosyltransferase involved in cell wall biosynthesis
VASLLDLSKILPTGTRVRKDEVPGDLARDELPLRIEQRKSNRQPVKAGLELLRERFLWPVIARRTIALYEELLLERSA